MADAGRERMIVRSPGWAVRTVFNVQVKGRLSEADVYMESIGEEGGL